MNSTTLEEELMKFGFLGLHTRFLITDSDYALPTSKFLLGQFYTFYQAWAWENNLSKWKKKWDCDNFSSLYYVFAQICHVTAGERPEEGIAVGEMFYLQDKGGGHAVNLAMTEKGIIIIEPQNGTEIKLSDKEKLSCWAIRF
jgi:hypothetical protein